MNVPYVRTNDGSCRKSLKYRIQCQLDTRNEISRNINILIAILVTTMHTVILQGGLFNKSE